MTAVRFITQGVPASGAGAFTPVVSAVVSPKASTYGMVRITGGPAVASPSPHPAAIPDGPLPRSAQGSHAGAPDQRYPDIYVVHVTNMRPGNNTMRIASTNELPVPAVKITRLARIAQRPARVGGLRQITWPPAPQAWQDVTP